VTIICHTDQEEENLSRLFPQKGPAVFKSRYFSERRALANWRPTSGTGSCSPTYGICALSHGSLGKCASSSPIKRQLLYDCFGIAGGTAPVLFNKKLLVLLDECGIPGLPHGAVDAIETLVRAARSSKQNLPFPVHSRRLTRPSAYPIDMTRLPRR